MISAVLLVAMVATITQGYPEGDLRHGAHEPSVRGASHIEPDIHKVSHISLDVDEAPRSEPGVVYGPPRVGSGIPEALNAEIEAFPQSGPDDPGLPHAGDELREKPHLGPDFHTEPQLKVQISYPFGLEAHNEPFPGMDMVLRHGNDDYSVPHSDSGPYRVKEVPAHYSFDYAIHDNYAGNHFGHTENSDDYNTKGSYFVHLPDGRVQTVTYTVDEYGYQPHVVYRGVAKHTEFPIHHVTGPVRRSGAHLHHSDGPVHHSGANLHHNDGPVYHRSDEDHHTKSITHESIHHTDKSHLHHTDKSHLHHTDKNHFHHTDKSHLHHTNDHTHHNQGLTHRDPVPIFYDRVPLHREPAAIHRSQSPIIHHNTAHSKHDAFPIHFGPAPILHDTIPVHASSHSLYGPPN